MGRHSLASSLSFHLAHQVVRSASRPSTPTKPLARTRPDSATPSHRKESTLAAAVPCSASVPIAPTVPASRRKPLSVVPASARPPEQSLPSYNRLQSVQDHPS